MLILLRRADTRSWTAEELNRELRASPGLVEEHVAKLRQAGLVIEELDGRYRYRPATAELDQLIGELEAAYAVRPLGIVQEILAAPNDKIHTFADAFRLKRD